MLTIMLCLLVKLAVSQHPGSWITPAAWNLSAPINIGSLGKATKVSLYGIAGMQSGMFNYATLSAVAVKPLNRNWFAFGGVTTAMPYTSCTVCLPGKYRNNGYQVQGGLMYMNEARTFSISGSVRYSQSSFPLYGPAYYAPSPHGNLLP
ncbi:MAG: hypothetical protein QM664_05940 [Flavihumibacter sp.]